MLVMAENASESQPPLETSSRDNVPSSSTRAADMKSGSSAPPAQSITSEIRYTSPTTQDPATSAGASVKSEAQEASDNAQSSVPLSAAQLQHSEMTGPSPYGTRSRNRTGSTRPNYAEDKEVDMDFEWSSNKKQNPPAANSVQQVDSDKSSGAGTRRSTGNGGPVTSKNAAAVSPAPKEGIPGMSTFSVNSDPNTAMPQGKKRKAPGGNMSTLGVSGHTSSHGPGRKNNASTSTGSSRESNMYSFDNSQGYIKHGKLKADDGTTFSVNGRPCLYV